MPNRETDYYRRLTQEMGEIPEINLVLKTLSQGIRISLGTARTRPIIADSIQPMTIEKIARELPAFMKNNFPSTRGKTIKLFGSAQDARDRKPPLIEIKLAE